MLDPDTDTPVDPRENRRVLRVRSGQAGLRQCWLDLERWRRVFAQEALIQSSRDNADAIAQLHAACNLIAGVGERLNQEAVSPWQSTFL